MKLPATGRVSRHFRRLALRPGPRFVWQALVESMGVSLAAALLLHELLPMPTSPTFRDEELGFASVVLVAPLLETLVCQTIPVLIAQRFTRRVRVLTLVGWLPFGVAHFHNSVGSGLAAGLAGGFYLGFAYAVWARHSHVQAFVITFAIHALGNLACLLALWSL